LLIEGIAISAYCIGAEKAFIYIRGEFRWIADILEKAIGDARDDGQLEGLDIVVHRGAGSYVCGEETALIESLEGKRGNPRAKPPFPANIGLYGCPTIVNNVETLSLVPHIVDNGAEAFKKIGVDGNYGPKLFGVSGHVNRPGVYEFALGTPLREILEAAGGVKGVFKAAVVGGLSAPIMRADEALRLNMDYDSCIKAATMLGSGGIIVMNDTVSMPQIALRTIRFYLHESCGQCAPCREGTYRVAEMLAGLLDGHGTNHDIEKTVDICDRIIGLTLCPTGDSFAMPIRSMIRKFRDEFDALVARVD
jgi:NADH:ubiquinone oxidoreductase subunit F (NADH-binding)